MDCKQIHSHTDCQTHKQTVKQKKVKIKNKTTLSVDSGPPDTECLYYPLDMEGVIAANSYKKANNIHNNSNKNFHPHNFCMTVPIFLLTKQDKKINLISTFLQVVTLTKNL